MVDFYLTQTYFLQLKQFIVQHRWLVFHICSGVVGVLMLLVGVLVLIARPDLEESSLVSAHGLPPTHIQVYVSGAVQRPGVYTLTEGQRWSDVITLAGGMSADVDPYVTHNQLNLASKLEDGLHIHIPLRAESILQKQDQSVSDELPLLSQATVETDPDTISVNAASVETLMTLPQIGEKRAADIVAGRPYADLRELVTKKIITEKMYTAIKDVISL